MIGIAIPVHNEAALLAACLASVRAAAAHPQLRGEAVYTVVVLDACTDDSHAIALEYGVALLHVDARNVGHARATGAAALLAAGARWLAFTDADTRVCADWLVAQLLLGADAVCGPVSVDDWSDHPPHVRETFYRMYVDADGHRHVHGANLGVTANAYRRAGGFPPLACSEDAALVDLLIATGASIAWSAAPRVVTSARKESRARGGFGDTLASWVVE
ncbi:glycosyltransferase [Paraburkholderia flava]|uniref:glycosyltransferase n=1 Tax=Paraburkholderia flava TaxID=2547393 RepID=UPI00105D5BB5|nr:glycosyltransferase [Paraburkholderia flava]